MDLSSLPVFANLSSDEQAHFVSWAERITLPANKVLFYEGEPTDFLYVLVSGECALSYGEESRGRVQGFSMLDTVATLGGLPHSLKVTAVTDCEFLRWSMDTLWEIPSFSPFARRYLASQLQAAQTRRDELATPLHRLPGPFRFDDVTMFFAFCEADRPTIKNLLPPNLSLFQRPARSTASVLVALAKFPKAYPEGRPDALFRYTETTFFIPVRHKTAFGFYVPYIYPSTYEPIIAGRDIYGFPKVLGETRFFANEVALKVNDAPLLNLIWASSEATDETRLVRGLFDWLGIEGRLASAAFQAGEVLRKVARLPAYRRVDVYNHKQIPAADTTLENPKYEIDQLTRATFGVLRWYQIAKLKEPQFAVQNSPLGHLVLREAYRTQLDMRLSAGRVIHPYQDH